MDIKQVKQLREMTGAGLQDCQQALAEAKGDLDKAQEILRKKGQKIAAKKEIRSTKEGIVEPYLHANKKLGVMVLLECETDFVASSDDFQELAHHIAMQVAAMNPRWIKPEDVPAEVVNKEKEIYREEIDKGKPAKIQEKIIQGKLDKFYQEVCLLKQPFIKDDQLTIEQLIKEKIAKLGENIQVGDFARLSL